MTLTVLTPEKATTIADVSSVLLPGSSGQFQVLKGHAPLISSLTQGVVRYVQEGKTQELEVDGGVVRVERDEISITIEQ